MSALDRVSLGSADAYIALEADSPWPSASAEEILMIEPPRSVLN